MSQQSHWLTLARWTPLVILTDLDGTLIPFAATPEAARPSPALVALLSDLASSPGVTVAVVSGRPRETLESFFQSCPDLLLVAEHGGWRRDGAWQPAVEASQEEVDDLTDALQHVTRRHPGALTERKTWSVAFHFRGIAAEERDAAVIEVETLRCRLAAASSPIRGAAGLRGVGGASRPHGQGHGDRLAARARGGPDPTARPRRRRDRRGHVPRVAGGGRVHRGGNRKRPRDGGGLAPQDSQQRRELSPLAPRGPPGRNHGRGQSAATTHRDPRRGSADVSVPSAW